jgi:hypothetical protein
MFAFFNLNALPENMSPLIREALSCIQKGIRYTDFGFDEGFLQAAL